MSIRHRIPIREFGFSNEPFTLVSETTADGARQAAERARAEADRARAARLQADLGLCPQTPGGVLGSGAKPQA